MANRYAELHDAQQANVDALINSLAGTRADDVLGYAELTAAQRANVDALIIALAVTRRAAENED